MDGTAELELILGGGQSLVGSGHPGRCVTPRCPRASRASAGGSLGLKMLPWVEEVAWLWQPGFPPWRRVVPPPMPRLLEGRWVRVRTWGRCPGLPVCITQGAVEAHATPCLSFPTAVSLALPPPPPVGCGGGRGAGQARGSSPGSARPYYFPTTVSSSLLVKLDPAVHNSH